VVFTDILKVVMKPSFKEDKATQAAALFLMLRGAPMSHLKLMKLLYLAEREAFIRLGRPITFDSYVSMSHGPVLSQTYDLLTGESQDKGYWENAITAPENYEVTLKSDPGTDKLSSAEEEIIKEIFGKFGRKSRWELRDFTHTLDEWQDPQGSSIRIDYREILRAGKKTDAEIEAIISDIENIALLEKMFE